MYAQPSSITQALKRIDRYFEDYKAQIKNRLSEIVQPTNWGKIDRV